MTIPCLSNAFLNASGFFMISFLSHTSRKRSARIHLFPYFFLSDSPSDIKQKHIIQYISHHPSIQKPDKDCPESLTFSAGFLKNPSPSAVRSLCCPRVGGPAFNIRITSVYGRLIQVKRQLSSTIPLYWPIYLIYHILPPFLHLYLSFSIIYITKNLNSTAQKRRAIYTLRFLFHHYLRIMNNFLRDTKIISPYRSFFFLTKITIIAPNAAAARSTYSMIGKWSPVTGLFT